MDIGLLTHAQTIALGIKRPEDVVVLANGRIFASHHDATVAEIFPDGSFIALGPKIGATNGLNALPDGRLILANFGIYDGVAGPLEMFDPETGQRDILVSSVGGRHLSSANYPIIDKKGRIFCANSTGAPTWPQALDGRKDGFIFVHLPDGSAEILAEGLSFPNGLALSGDEKTLFCCQTSAANVLAFPILEKDGQVTLGTPTQYGPILGLLAPGPIDEANLPPPEIMALLGYTDGCGVDENGHLWVTLPAANKIIAVAPDGTVTTIAHDPSGAIINHPTNVTWGGDDMKDLYIGSLHAPHVVKARSPVAGLRLAHQR